MGIWEKLFGTTARQDDSIEKPIESMTDAEVMGELTRIAKKEGRAEFLSEFIARGGGPRELLNLERRAERMRRP
jgi:hypothetical protein